MAWGTQQYGIRPWGWRYVSPGNAPLRHRFLVDNIARYVGTPVPKTVWNEFDEHGLLEGLYRNKAETNWEYKRRLLDVFINRANSTYRGLVNGITRELGLALFQPVIINPRVASNGEFLAPDPYIKFDGVYLYLYSDYSNDLLDYQIDRYEAGGNYEHLGRLVDLINTTHYFEATLDADVDPYTRSMTIINQSNRIETEEPVLSSNKFQLEHGRIIRGTIFFKDTNIFATEVGSENLVSSLGKYYIDYYNGVIRSFSIPGIEASVRYSYVDYPFEPWASPVILHDINNDNFKVKMFEQVLLDDGTYTHGVATEIGLDIINELLGVTPMYWGV
jgi:hypothetical protein